MGSAGISPSLCIEFDTKENNCNGSGGGNDPNLCCNPPSGTGDHWALYQNGDAFNDLLPSTCFMNGSTGLSIDDGTDHSLIVNWNLSTLSLTVILDGSTIINYTGDIVANIFGGNPMVYYGLTAMTSGSHSNAQSFCEISVNSNTDCCSTTPGFVD